MDIVSVEIQHCLVQPPLPQPLNCAANAGNSSKNSKPSTVCAAAPSSSNSSSRSARGKPCGKDPMAFCGAISVRRIIHAYARIVRRLVPAWLIGLLEMVESLRRAADRVGGRAGGAGGVEIAPRGPGRG